MKTFAEVLALALGVFILPILVMPLLVWHCPECGEPVETCEHARRDRSEEYDRIGRS